MSERYASLRDYHYPLLPDRTLETRLDGERLTIASASGSLPHSSLLLPIRLQATLAGRWCAPDITLMLNDTPLGRQYFEPGVHGQRYLELSALSEQALDKPGVVRLTSRHARLISVGPLMQFIHPALDDGPLLVLAPHPDDAEIAAYGLYRHHAERSWIVTLSAGERLPRLDRQYPPGLDDQLATATRRKGQLRAWNAATTPWLAGLPPSRQIMLGHFNRMLPEMLKSPEQNFPHPLDPCVHPSDFRRFNTLTLPTDPDSRCQGQQLLSELRFVLEHIRPTTIVTPDPRVDPHRDHIATTQAIARVIGDGAPAPTRFLLYANHLRGTTLFPYGPNGAMSALPPARLEQDIASRHLSQPLPLATQREKALALWSMHDLQPEVSRDRWRQRRLRQRLLGQHWQAPRAAAYFRTAIKANEAFRQVDRAEALLE